MLMHKTVIDPTAGNELVEDTDISETAYSRGVVIDYEDYKRVYLSGVTPVDAADSSIAAQTRDVLETIEGLLSECGGTMNDIVRVRIFVEDVIDEEFTTVHQVRGEFFSREHFPASTLIEIDSIVRGNIEIEAEAIVPAEEWTVDTMNL